MSLRFSRVQSRLVRTARTRKTAAAFVMLTLAVAAPGLLGASPANAAAVAPSSDLSDSTINRSLDHLAKSMAAALVDPGLRSTIHGAIKKRFDGDTNALWNSLAMDPTFSGKVAGARQSGDEIAQEAAAIPRLQLAIPVNFESWDPAKYAPLVAYFPEGVDDTKLKTITAFDAAGNPQLLDAQVPPKRPVIVLGLNERTDEKGILVGAQNASPSKAKTLLNSVAAAPARYSVDMSIVVLIDDKEPWAKGDAEISLRAKSRGCGGVEYFEPNWPSLNNDGEVWGPVGGRDLGQTACDVYFYWWEDDGGAFDFELGLGDFSLGVAMDDSDDLIGGKRLPYEWFEGGTDDKTAWSALQQWTR